MRPSFKFKVLISCSKTDMLIYTEIKEDKYGVERTVVIGTSQSVW